MVAWILHLFRLAAIFKLMADLIKKVSRALDGEPEMEPSKESTCPFSEGCKHHLSPGDILRYSLVIALSVFLFLLILSLFFPRVITPPDIEFLRELVNIFHHAASVPVPSK